jgi:hypothetical protein
LVSADETRGQSFFFLCLSGHGRARVADGAERSIVE